MYLRHSTVRKNGKTHTYWRLVRSVRTGTKVRQETVAQLGELDAEGRVRAQALAASIAGVEHQPGLFEEATPPRARARRAPGVAPRTRPALWRRLAGLAAVASRGLRSPAGRAAAAGPGRSALGDDGRGAGHRPPV